ncbi:hypothetical protein PoB_002491700 [Plakobranchus ocellatus]|uniref:Uncharacterized protein n=1 Tax=Plakobranchus ocellatus TaxID=259542 RepID=A0AAV3ZUQ4_9GAST|nr:hypothetical protein PoB_002491700 [Plakobranchus ocellatus]
MWSSIQAPTAPSQRHTFIDLDLVRVRALRLTEVLMAQWIAKPPRYLQRSICHGFKPRHPRPGLTGGLKAGYHFIVDWLYTKTGRITGRCHDNTSTNGAATVV